MPIKKGLPKLLDRLGRNRMNYLSRIIARFERQKAKGIAKYGQPLEQNNREVLEAIEAIAEELTDGLMYLEEVKEKLQDRLRR